MKHKLLLLTAFFVFLFCSTLTAKTFVVSRNGAEVTATLDGKTWTAKTNIDTKDPTLVLVAFFASYFSQTEEWKDFVAEFVGDKENSILCMEEAYENLYGQTDSISVTIDFAKFKDNGGGFAFFTVKIAYTYKGESGEGEDQVTLAKDEKGDRCIVELPR